MPEQTVVEDVRVPYAELVIRPADARPVVISLFNGTGDVVISEGSCDDMQLAQTICGIIANVSRAMWNVRKIKEELPRLKDDGSLDGDDDPPW